MQGTTDPPNEVFIVTKKVRKVFATIFYSADHDGRAGDLYLKDLYTQWDQLDLLRKRAMVPRSVSRRLEQIRTRGVLVFTSPTQQRNSLRIRRDTLVTGSLGGSNGYYEF